MYWLIPVGLLLRDPLARLAALVELLVPLVAEASDDADEGLPLLAVPREAEDSDFVLVLLLFMAVYILVLSLFGPCQDPVVLRFRGLRLNGLTLLIVVAPALLALGGR